MKILYHRWSAGIFLLLLILLPYILVLPSIATNPTVYDNYDSETSTGEINIYYQSGSAFQYVQERLNLTNTTLRIIVGTNFYYHTSSSALMQIQAVDNSSGVVASSDNITIDDSGEVKKLYSYYFADDPYLLSRGSHFIRLIGMNSSPISIYYTSTPSNLSYYSNETTGMGNWVMDSNQYLIQFIEEDVVNLTSTENITGQIDYATTNDAVDAYLLDFPAQPVKIVLEMNASVANFNLELYNYSNNGDMVLQNSTVSTSGNFDHEILTYIPPAAGLHVLLVKPNDKDVDISNYTLSWFNSSNEIDVSRPVIAFDNALSELDITGVTASMDGYSYNGSSYLPEIAEYAIYREIDNSVVGSNGSLFDYNNDSLWINENLDVSGLDPGVYYVRARFEDNKGNAIGISPKSSRFFVLGNLSVTAATVSYIGGMNQKLNISGISVDNTTTLDIFTYTIFDNTLKANTSITGILTYESGSQTWYANNVDVSSLSDGQHFVLGYFEDQSENKFGIGNVSSSTLNLFTVQHIIEVNQAYTSYTNQWIQQLEIGALANTSYQGNGVGRNIQANESIVTYQIYHNSTGFSGISGNLSWTGSSWNSTITVANLTEGPHCVQITFTNNTMYYNTSGSLNSSIFTVNHILNITSVSQIYTGNTTQAVTVEVTANTSYYGNGIGTPIQYNPDAIVLCTIVNSSNSVLTSVTDLAIWYGASSSWKVDVSTASLPEGDYYVLVNFSVFSNSFNASATQNTSSFTIKHIITLTVPTPIFNPDTASLDIVGIIATDSYSVYHHINDSTVISTYFEIFNYTSQESLGIYGDLTYNSTFDDWRNTSIDLSIYPEGQFFIHVNITSIDVPEGAAVNSSPFDLVHKIVITGITLNYTADFTQTLNITVAYAESAYQYHTSDNISYSNYRFYYWNNQSAVLSPDLGGNLTERVSGWTILVNVSQLPAGEYYAVVNFADPTAANSKGSKDTTNFTVTHSLNVSSPVINYIDNLDQDLNISCYVNSSYYFQRNFNSSTFGTGKYHIFLDNGTPTSITGDLNWNGSRWVAINADTSLLPVGTYRIICNFSTPYTLGNSALSNNFTVVHVINISSPTVTFNNETNLLTILHVTSQSSYLAFNYLTNLTALLSYFEIFDSSNTTTGITGQLSWNGSEWQVLDFSIPSLNEGQYYVKIYFNDSQTTITSISSDFFIVDYPEQEIDWLVIILIILLVVAVAIVLFWSLFPEKPETRSEQL